jgi:uncharacterized HAD superfamily protein
LKKLIDFNEEQYDWLQKQVNASDEIRKALDLYRGKVNVEAIQGMRAAFLKLTKRMDEMEERFVEQYEMVEKTHDTLVELSNR